MRKTGAARQDETVEIRGIALLSGPNKKIFHESEIAVIGGGLVGLSLAHGLAGAGLSVTILDEGDVAHRASRGNFALVWVQGKGGGGVLSPDYAHWTLRSSDLWPDFAAELTAETGIDTAHARPGGFALCLDEAELDARAVELKRLHNQAPASARVEVLDAGAIRAALPDVGPDVVGGTYCAADGHVNSLRTFRALHEAVRLRGAAYRPNAGVEAIRPTSDGFAITTAAGEVRARKLVLAAGLGNARLAPMVGLHAPVRPERGQIMVTEKVAPFLHHPIVNIRQTDEGGVMIGDSKEDAGFDERGGLAVMAAIAQRAQRLFPVLGQARIVRSWAALRVMSPDGLPIYERSLTHPGAYLATCHSGVTLAAAHARVLAAAIAADDWPAALAPFTAARFADVPAAA